LKNSNGVPLYIQIAQDYKDKINNGILCPGAKLPKHSELASIHNTSVSTVQKALIYLSKQGFIKATRKKGTFVTDYHHHHRDEDVSKNQIQTVYFVYDNVSMNTLSQELHQRMFEGIRKACAKNKIKFAMFDLRGTSHLPSDENSGIILFGFWGAELGYPEPNSLEAVERWVLEGRRLVMVHQYFPHLNVTHINCDNYSGGFLATQHLIKQGHERIALLIQGRSDLEIDPEFVLRMQGYKMALRSHGIPVDLDLIKTLRIELNNCGNGYRSVYESTKSLMSSNNPPTAIFAGTDFFALEALYAAEDLGLRVPRDLSIIGYDNYSIGEDTLPGLTTVDQDFETLGRLTVETLLKEPNIDSNEILVTTQLVIRGSTALRQS